MASSVTSLLTLTSIALLFSLLLSPATPAARGTRDNRRWMMRSRRGGSGGDGDDGECRGSDIVITQAVGRPLPNGIPTYIVEISSTCTSDCRISDVHVSCGLFASAKLVNPMIFRRVMPNDCVVNDGKPMESGLTLSFVYANSFLYPISLSHANMC